MPTIFELLEQTHLKAFVREVGLPEDPSSSGPNEQRWEDVDRETVQQSIEVCQARIDELQNIVDSMAAKGQQSDIQLDKVRRKLEQAKRRLNAGRLSESMLKTDEIHTALNLRRKRYSQMTDLSGRQQQDDDFCDVKIARGKYRELASDLERMIRAIHDANETDAADSYNKQLETIRLGEPLAENDFKQAVDELEVLHAETSAFLKKLCGRRLPFKDIRSRHEELTKMYKSLMKLNRKGEIKTKTDKTKQQTFSRTNKLVPKELIEDVGLRLQSLEYVMNGDSLPACEVAKELLHETSDILDDIERNTEYYETAAEYVQSAQRILDRWKDEVASYDQSLFLPLIKYHEELPQEMKTLRPTHAKDQAIEHQKNVKKSFYIAKETHRNRQEFKEHAKRAKQVFGKLGKIMKYRFGPDDSKVLERMGVTMPEYYGTLADELHAAQRQADTYESESVEFAESEAERIADAATELLERFGEADLPVAADWQDEYVNDYRTRRDQHLKNEELKTEFNELRKKTKFRKQCTATAKRAKKLGMDPTPIEMMTNEYDAIKATAEYENDYGAALRDFKWLIEKLRARQSEVKVFKDVNDTKLIEMAGELSGEVSRFKDYLDQFYDEAIYRKYEAELQELGVDGNKIRGVIKLAGAHLDVSDLKEAAGDISNRDVKVRKAAREVCLRSIRRNKSLLANYKPARHFQMQPFAPEDHVQLLYECFKKAEILFLTSLSKD